MWLGLNSVLLLATLPADLAAVQSLTAAVQALLAVAGVSDDGEAATTDERALLSQIDVLLAAADTPASAVEHSTARATSDAVRYEEVLAAFEAGEHSAARDSAVAPTYDEVLAAFEDGTHPLLLEPDEQPPARPRPSRDVEALLRRERRRRRRAEVSDSTTPFVFAAHVRPLTQRRGPAFSRAAGGVGRGAA